MSIIRYTSATKDNDPLLAYLKENFERKYGSETAEFGVYEFGDKLKYIRYIEEKEKSEFLAWISFYTFYFDLKCIAIKYTHFKPFKLYGIVDGPTAIHERGRMRPPTKTDIPETIEHKDLLLFDLLKRNPEENHQTLFFIYTSECQDTSMIRTQLLDLGVQKFKVPEYIRMDFRYYSTYSNMERDLIATVFGLNPVSDLEALLSLTNSLKQKLMGELVTTKEDLHRYIMRDLNSNRIDMNDPLCIDSPELYEWLELMGDNLNQRELDIGFLLLNRVMAWFMGTRGLQVVFKHTSEDVNRRRVPTLKYWPLTQVSEFLNSLVFKSRFHTDMSEWRAEDIERWKLQQKEKEGNGRSRKRRRNNNDPEPTEENPNPPRIVSWFKIWRESRLHLIVTSVIFIPYSIKEQDWNRSPHSNPNIYETRMTLNEFKGYKKTYDYAASMYSLDIARQWIADWRKIIDQTMCGGNVTYYEYIHKWIAWTIQKPTIKTMVMILITAQQGTGKGFIGRVFAEWWGTHFYTVSGTDLTRRFMWFLSSCKMCFVDEAKPTIGTISQLNSLISEKTLELEAKGVDSVNRENFTEFFGATNSDPALELTSDARRFFWVKAPTMDGATLERWKKWVSTVWDNLLNHPQYGSGGAWAILYWYSLMNLDDFHPMLQLPKTETIRKCIEASMSPVHRWWKYVLEMRQLSEEDMPGAVNLESKRITWLNLRKMHMTNRLFKEIYDARRIQLTDATFKEEMLNIAEVNIDENDSTKIKFSGWLSQIRKWTRIYPDIPIATDKSLLDTPPNVKMLEDKIARHSNIQGLENYDKIELAYMITKLVDRVKEKDPQSSVVFNGSVMSRTSSSYLADDIIKFE